MRLFGLKMPYLFQYLPQFSPEIAIVEGHEEGDFYLFAEWM